MVAILFSIEALILRRKVYFILSFLTEKLKTAGVLMVSPKKKRGTNDISRLAMPIMCTGPFCALQK